MGGGHVCTQGREQKASLNMKSYKLKVSRGLAQVEVDKQFKHKLAISQAEGREKDQP